MENIAGPGPDPGPVLVETLQIRTAASNADRDHAD